MPLQDRTLHEIFVRSSHEGLGGVDARVKRLVPVPVRSPHEGLGYPQLREVEDRGYRSDYLVRG